QAQKLATTRRNNRNNTHPPPHRQISRRFNPSDTTPRKIPKFQRIQASTSIKTLKCDLRLFRNTQEFGQKATQVSPDYPVICARQSRFIDENNPGGRSLYVCAHPGLVNYSANAPRTT
ncbi:hypothetical protein QP381_04630, partial [Pauljensenia sp. UMB6358]|uniref:hypothetical protein n=1 Tax=Pauljensenia sp. UMB6358 TaxID=3046335 RepID=UPI00254ACE51